ncbi:MAG TPA: hypothetical protein VFU85_06785 [Nocardioides sp.]|nr:hypothetical protein [Nocardioides sp.]
MRRLALVLALSLLLPAPAEAGDAERWATSMAELGRTACAKDSARFAPTPPTRHTWTNACVQRMYRYWLATKSVHWDDCLREVRAWLSPQLIPTTTDPFDAAITACVERHVEAREQVRRDIQCPGLMCR